MRLLYSKAMSCQPGRLGAVVVSLVLVTPRFSSLLHPRPSFPRSHFHGNDGGNPSGGLRKHGGWMPADAGMTVMKRVRVLICRSRSRGHDGEKVQIRRVDEQKAPVSTGAFFARFGPLQPVVLNRIASDCLLAADNPCLLYTSRCV